MDSVWINALQMVSEMEEVFKGMLADTAAKTLSIRQIHTLAALFEKDGQSAGKLAREVGTASTAFTPVIDALVNSGFIRREVQEHDRRGVLIYLEPAGEALRKPITEAITEVNEFFPELDWTAAVMPTGKPEAEAI